MSIKLPSHLHRAQSGLLHFRIAIPPDLRHHFGQAEFYRSLYTPNISIAASAAQTLVIAFKRVFHELRQQTMSNAEKIPYSPLINYDKLMRRLELSKQKYMHQAERERLEDELNDAHRRLRAQVTKHEREISLILQAQDVRHVALPVPASTHTLPPLLSETIEDFIRFKLARGEWTGKTEHENRAVYDLFIRIVGDRPIASIDDEVMLDYLEKLNKLPPNINKIPAFIDKSIDEIIAIAPKAMAVRTINKNVERISSLFKWALNKKKYGIDHNPAAGMSLDEGRSERRKPFTTSELVALFSSDEFRNRDFEKPYSYWLMPMGLLTGARLGELCQLYLSDFIVFNGIHCINVSDEEKFQRLKTANSRRLAPIHSKLIDLGLLRYVEDLRRSGEERLFPELTPGRDGFSQVASKWFGRYKIRCGIKEKHKKVFHSFRHNFISSLLDDEVPEHAVAQIVGHEGELITSKVYWNQRDASKRQPTVEKCQMPDVVWRLIPAYEEVGFTMRRKDKA